MTRARAIFALLLLTLPLTACGTGSSATPTQAATRAASPSSMPLPKSPLNDLRTDIDKLGIPCIRGIDWTPATSGEYEGADTAGSCSDGKAVLTTHRGNDGSGPNFLALRAKARDFAASGGQETTIISADGWSVLTDPSTARKFVKAHPGATKFDP